MTVTSVFLFGTLRDAALRRIVLGADVPLWPARLAGWEVRRVAEGDWPVLVPAQAAVAEGGLARLTPDALARADYYESLFGYTRVPVTVEGAAGPEPADIWRPSGGGSAVAEGLSEAWSLSAWADQAGPLARAAAADAMALLGERPAEETARRWPTLRTRAQARLNASHPAPTTLRRRAEDGDLQVAARRTPYAGFFAVEEYDLRHARFGGGLSETVRRAAFVSADAVTVLPYDPARDRALLIEQFRAGPFARGDGQPWSLEAVAGRIDPGETPEESARREAREEAGLEIGRLIRLASYYPSPGAKSEFIYSFLGLADLPDGVEGVFGVAQENEDIRTHLIPADRLQDLVASGEINNAPLILSVMALERQRAALRG